MGSTQDLHIVGGGLVGPLAAIYMARKGFKVTLYEKRSDFRRTGIPVGRSINLAVTARGLRALEEVELRQDIMDIAIPMRGRMIHDVTGKTTMQPYGQKEHEVIYAASRGLLNVMLLDAAERYDNINIVFDAICQSYDPRAGILTFHDPVRNVERKVEAGVVMGADGAASAVRSALAQTVTGFQSSVDMLAYGYKELVIPPTGKGRFRIEKNALHIWPRHKHMLIALPNTDGSFTCTLFYPHQGAESFDGLKTKEDVEALFRRDFPDALDLMPTLADDFFSNPTGVLATLRCYPWSSGGRVCLLGDAAHAIVPFYAQGMNSGFEDCTVLNSLIDRTSPDWEDIFRRFEEIRKPNADAIAAMALENFVEMRDSVNDPAFILKKNVGFALEKKYPGRFIPRYSMVIFHPEIPYAQAREISAIQDNMLEKLCAGITSADQIDWAKADLLMNEYF